MVYKPKKSYQWATFERCVSADTVGAVFEKLEERDGAVTSANFLEESRPEDSATHALFEWDDHTAAEAYRMKQSGAVIRDLRVVYVTSDKEELKVSAYVNVCENNEKASYENITDALNDLGKRETILNRIRAELDAFIVRNQHIEELASILEDAAAKVRKRA